MTIEPLTGRLRPAAVKILREQWNGPMVVSKGRAIEAGELPGFVAVEQGEIVGLVTYQVENGECEIVTLNSLQENQGTGSRLIDAVKRAAGLAGCRRLWLVTTNDNCKCFRYYQKRGFTLAAAHILAIDKARKIKPAIPLNGEEKIPIRDELEFELALEPVLYKVNRYG